MIDWRPSEGINYTDELKQVITAEGSIAVLASAGSGKTELLAQKADYLFATGKCTWPRRVLSLTFKREAQYNIKKRVVKRCGSNSTRFDSFTFHAFAKSIVDRFKSLLPNEKKPIDTYDIASKSSEADGINKLTMNQIIVLSISIINSNETIKKLLVDSYSHIFIDEFQDTTNEQYELITCIFKGTDAKILSVGDMNQSIMIWAGARKTVFNDYITDFSASYKFLLTNYRSSEDIQRVLSVFQTFMENPANISYNSDESLGCTISIYRDEVHEAAHISNKIVELINSGIAASDICILTKQQSSIYTQIVRDSLSKLGINNLDMSELQDSLKEPVGEIFSLYIKVLICPEPKFTIKLHDLLLTINNIEPNDDKEEALSSSFYRFIHYQKESVTDAITVDELLSKVNAFISYVGFDKIISKWKQYKTESFYHGLWRVLELHLRDVFSKATSSVEAVKLFTADNAVQIMNVHKCKGLEYHAVFFIGLEDQAFWSYSRAQFENNCAIYVAISRAKELLEITYSLNREHRVNQSFNNKASSCNSLSEVYSTFTKHCKIPLKDMTV